MTSYTCKNKIDCVVEVDPYYHPDISLDVEATVWFEIQVKMSNLTEEIIRQQIRNEISGRKVGSS